MLYAVLIIEDLNIYFTSYVNIYINNKVFLFIYFDKLFNKL